MNILDIITKKKNNEKLDYEELEFAFNCYLGNRIPDYQMSSLLMAITINGLDIDEAYYLTKIFVDSGDVFSFSRDVVDKHSTGGVGDSTTLIVAPILASLGIPVVKMSGRGLGITGGTIDKLESIPGFNVNLSKDDYYNNLDDVNIVLGAQTSEIVPLDKVIYALRDVSGTTESIGLIASSIMSKKIACGAKYILIDIKYGSGALIKSIDDARVLSSYLVEIGNRFGKNVKTIITDMNMPLSNYIGNSLEVIGAIEVLKGKSNRLRDISLEIASHLVSMYKNISYDDAYLLCLNSINNNSAYDAFKKWISKQGGDLSGVVVSKNVLNLRAMEDGVISSIDALGVGRLSVKLGSGRYTKDSVIDYTVGIELIKNIGDVVSKGDIIAKLYVSDNNIKLDKSDVSFYMIK